MEDVDRLEDVLEAVVTGAVNTRHAAYLSAKAGMSRVASYEFLNLTAVENKLVVCYLTRLFNEVVVEVVATSATAVQIRTPSREYFLHVSHGPEMPLTEMEVQGTRDECEGCALLVHTGSRRYLVVESGGLTCDSDGIPSVCHNLTAGEVLSIKRDATCRNRLMLVSSRGRHVSHYTVSASGVDPLDSLVLRRRERTDQKLDGSHSVINTHSALNMHLRQNLGMAQQDIENLITETQESFKMYTVVSSGTTAWLSLITLLAILLICLIVRKFCQRRREMSDDTVYVPSVSSCA
jgi:glycogen debranching enzyme